jgi:hypothetical protein
MAKLEVTRCLSCPFYASYDDCTHTQCYHPKHKDEPGSYKNFMWPPEPVNVEAEGWFPEECPLKDDPVTVCQPSS